MPFLLHNGCRITMAGKPKSFVAHYNDQENPETVDTGYRTIPYTRVKPNTA